LKVHARFMTASAFPGSSRPIVPLWPTASYATHSWPPPKACPPSLPFLPLNLSKRWTASSSTSSAEGCTRCTDSTAAVVGSHGSAVGQGVEDGREGGRHLARFPDDHYEHGTGGWMSSELC